MNSESKFCEGCGNYPHDGECDPVQYREHQRWVKDWLIPHNQILDAYHTVPHVEMEVTVKFKILVKNDYLTDMKSRLRAEDCARRLFSYREPVSHVEVTNVKLGELKDIDKIALPFYLRMEGWSIKHHRIWNLRYAESNSDVRVIRVEDVDIKKLLGIMVKPLTDNTAKIHCMCLQRYLDIDTTLDKCPEDVFKAMKEHECVPWPG